MNTWGRNWWKWRKLYEETAQLFTRSTTYLITLHPHHLILTLLVSVWARMALPQWASSTKMWVFKVELLHVHQLWVLLAGPVLSPTEWKCGHPHLGCYPQCTEHIVCEYVCCLTAFSWDAHISAAKKSLENFLKRLTVSSWVEGTTSNALNSSCRPLRSS